MKRNISKALPGIARGVNSIVLNAAALGDSDLGCFDKAAQDSREPESPSRQLLLGQKYPVNDRPRIIPKNQFRQRLEINRAAFQARRALLQLFEDGFVLPLQDVRRVDSVGF